MTADEAMAAPPEETERTMTDDAVDLLRDVLRAERMLARDIKRQATDAGISDKTLRVARQRLAVVSSREGFGADTKTFWALGPAPFVPSEPTRAPSNNGAQMDSQGTNGSADAHEMVL
jgi:putative DNA primase/helicase